MCSALHVRLDAASPCPCTARRCSFSITAGSMSSSAGERADIDDVLEQLALARVGVVVVADRGQRHADDVDVVAELRRRQRLGRIVEQVAAGLDLGDVLVPGLRVHRDHQVDAAAPAEIAGLDDAHLVPGRQALDVGREDVARATGTPMRRIALANSSLAVAEPEPLTLANLTTKSLTLLSQARLSACDIRRLACVISSRNFCMSQAPVGQRSAHRPQCRQTSSSLTMMRPVFSASET